MQTDTFVREGIRYAIWREAIDRKDSAEYKEKEGAVSGAELICCEDGEGEIYLPEEIEGERLLWAAPYAFSRTSVTEVHLPRYMEKIGKYIFYRCFKLEKLAFSDSLSDIGAGAFTGCNIRELVIDFYKGEQSALKFIADEIRYRLVVTMRHHRADGRIETAKVLFPEHYEEAVENTPARIVETHYHGSGGNYRQCFYNRELNYREYDSLLPRAIAEEPAETVAEMAALRLLWPCKLQEEAKKQYEAYLTSHMDAAADVYVEREDAEMLRIFGQKGYWTKDSLEYAVDIAAKRKKTEILSLLMEERYRLFPKKKKVFEL